MPGWFIERRRAMVLTAQNTGLGNNLGTYLLIGISVVILFLLIRVIILEIKRRKRSKEVMEIWGPVPPKESEIVEQNAVVASKRCGVDANPSCHSKKFFVSFRTEDGEITEYAVWEDLYLSAYEGQAGLLTTANGRFYHFDED